MSSLPASAPGSASGRLTSEAAAVADGDERCAGDIVRLAGLCGRRELNGTLVTLVRWKESQGRWAVLTETNEELSVKPQNIEPLVLLGDGTLARERELLRGCNPPALTVGDACNICWLSGRHDLNGTRVRLIAWQAEQGRWLVRTEGTDAPPEELSIKPQNVEHPTLTARRRDFRLQLLELPGNEKLRNRNKNMVQVGTEGLVPSKWAIAPPHARDGWRIKALLNAIDHVIRKAAAPRTLRETTEMQASTTLSNFLRDPLASELVDLTYSRRSECDGGYAFPDGTSPLGLSAGYGHPTCISVLLEAGASVNLETPPLIAPSLLNKADQMWTPLDQACRTDRAPHGSYNTAVELLLQAGGVSTANGTLARLLITGRYPTLQLISMHGGVTQEPSTLNHSGFSATLDGHAAFFAQRQRDWWTPLHHFQFLLPQATRRLLRAGADPHARKPGGRASSATEETPHDVALRLAALAEADGPCDSAKMMLAAAKPWSPEHHELWPSATRALAVELLLLGQRLGDKLAASSPPKPQPASSSGGAGGSAAGGGQVDVTKSHAFVHDAWIPSIMPKALEAHRTERGRATGQSCRELGVKLGFDDLRDVGKGAKANGFEAELDLRPRVVPQGDGIVAIIL